MLSGKQEMQEMQEMQEKQEMLTNYSANSRREVSWRQLAGCLRNHTRSWRPGKPQTLQLAKHITNQ